MNFKENKGIYLQITDRICNEIVRCLYTEGERIPSVREYAAKMEVNPNTVMRAFETLQQQELIFNKRGLGCFVAEGAVERIRMHRREVFEKEKANAFFEQMELLGLTMDDIHCLYKAYLKNTNNNPNK